MIGTLVLVAVLDRRSWELVPHTIRLIEEENLRTSQMVANDNLRELANLYGASDRYEVVSFRPDQVCTCVRNNVQFFTKTVTDTGELLPSREV